MSRLGLRGSARSPGSIPNIEHNDPSGAQKNISGTGGVISSVIATSTTVTPVGDGAMLRVVNTSASVQFIWVGKESLAPGTVTIANGMALPPNSVDLFFSDISDDDKDAMVVKTSNSAVQVVILAV